MSASSHLSDAFLRDLARYVGAMRARGMGVDGEDFLAVWLSESGINPHQPNNAGHAFYGLNQLGEFHFPAVGFRGSASDYLSLSADEQLPYVMRYYENATAGDVRLLRDRSSLYLVNFTPAFVEHADEPSWVIAAEGGPRQDIYRANRAIDRAGKGWIQVSDLGAFVDGATAGRPGYWAEVVGRYRAVAGSPGPSSGPSAWSWRAAAGVVLGLGALGLAARAAGPRVIPDLVRKIRSTAHRRLT